MVFMALAQLRESLDPHSCVQPPKHTHGKPKRVKYAISTIQGEGGYNNSAGWKELKKKNLTKRALHKYGKIKT